MTHVSTSELLEACGGELLRPAERSVSAGLTTDSRCITDGCLFIALTGERFDGNRFAAEATRRGAAAPFFTSAGGGCRPCR